MTLRNTLTTLIIGLLVATLGSGCNSGSRSSGGAGLTAPKTTSYAGAMQTARMDHGVALLESSCVMILGGATLYESATDTVEVFDAKSMATFAFHARLTGPRAGHTVAEVESGNALVLGGWDASGRGLRSIERFDVATQSFIQEDALLLHSHVRGAVSVELEAGRIVFVGGRGTGAVEVFDLAARSARKVVDLPHVREGAQLTKVGEELYFVYGGEANDPAAPTGFWLDLASGESTPADPIDDLGVQGDATRIPTGGIVFASPKEPGVAWLAGGRWKGKDNRGVLRLEQGQPSRFLRDQPSFRRPRVGAAHVGLDGTFTVFGGTWNGLPVAGAERIYPTLQDVAALNDGRETMRAISLEEGELALIGGRGADGRPSALIDLIVPEGAARRDASAEYEKAAELAAQDQELRDALQSEGQELESTRGTITERRAELARAEAALAQALNAIDRLEAEIAAADEATKAAEGEVARLEALVAQRQQELQQAQSDRNAAADARTAAQIRLSSAQSSLRAAQSRANASRNQANQLQAEVQASQAEASQLQSKASALRAQLF